VRSPYRFRRFFSRRTRNPALSRLIAKHARLPAAILRKEPVLPYLTPTPRYGRPAESLSPVGKPARSITAVASCRCCSAPPDGCFHPLATPLYPLRPLRRELLDASIRPSCHDQAIASISEEPVEHNPQQDNEKLHPPRSTFRVQIAIHSQRQRAKQPFFRTQRRGLHLSATTATASSEFNRRRLRRVAKQRLVATNRTQIANDVLNKLPALRWQHQ
jgi:hypothetical protein